MDRGATERERSLAGFMRAVRSGDSGEVRRQLAAGRSANGVDLDLYTPLHRLVEVFDAQRHGAVAQALLAAGADVNASAPALDGWTPLHYAAWHGNAAAVRLLLAAGADATLLDWYGRTALDWARAGAHTAAAQRLREATQGARSRL